MFYIKEVIMEKSKYTKLLRNIILFISLILITFYIIFKDQSISEIFNIVKNIDKKFVLIAIRFNVLILYM